MSNALVSGRLTTFKAGSRGELTGVPSGALPDGDPVTSVGEHRMDFSELAVGAGLRLKSIRKKSEGLQEKHDILRDRIRRIDHDWAVVSLAYYVEKKRRERSGGGWC